jgi:hypothetical protein
MLALLYPHLTTSSKVVQSTLQTESTARHARENILDSLAGDGNYTTVFDVTFGHRTALSVPMIPLFSKTKCRFHLVSQISHST